MAKSDPDAKKIERSITEPALKKALADAAAGLEYVLRDPAVGGLELRVRGGAVTYTVRCRFLGRQKRYAIAQVRKEAGRLTILPQEARRWAQIVKDYAGDDIDPSPHLLSLKTGIPVPVLRAEAAKRGPVSITWEEARKLFLDVKAATRRGATYDDYRNILFNTPELRVFEGRMVAGIGREDVAEVLAKVHKRAEPHSEHVQRVLSSMWSTLAKPEYQRKTGVVPYCIRDVRAPERTLYERGDPHAPDYAEIDAPPTIIELGRAVAIAKSGGYGPRASDALLVLLASAQRRRPIAGMHRRDFTEFDDEVLWAMAPYFRKSAAKKRSRNSHLVPLVGWGAAAARRLDKAAGSNPWWLPVRWTKIDRDPKQPHANPNWITKLFKWMPGVGFSPHGARAALASYGSEHLGWAKDEDKIILDHMEGFDPGDVTAQHYNTNPQIVRKRQMMQQWIDFLDSCERQAIEADPSLGRIVGGRIVYDVEAIREGIYRERYKEAGWRKALKRAAKNGGKLPWQDDVSALGHFRPKPVVRAMSDLPG